jgi:hypothetical protein
MSQSPYTSQPASAFWSKAVAKDFSEADVVGDEAVLTAEDRVASAGSCFASNLVPYLERSGIAYVRTELPHPAFAHLPDNLGYRNFSAAYGNIYTAAQLRQLLERCLGEFNPAEDRWYTDGQIIDPFRPGLRYRARSDAEFDALTRQHLAAVRRAFTAASAFVFTLGLSEGWICTADGAALPACPSTVAGEFDPRRHAFKNYTVAEVRDHLIEFVAKLRTINPTVRIILTVSPVPLVATATSQHVLAATIYSKSVLRAAAGEVCSAVPGVRYFPAYEIVTGPQAPEDFFEVDRRNVSEKGVATVMSALLAHCATGSEPSRQQPNTAPKGDGWQSASRRFVECECEEAYADSAN